MRRAIGLVAFVGLLAAACSDDDGSGSATSTPPTDSAAEAETPDEPDEPTLPTAPEAQRVDLDPPTFSNPTQVTNPLFPISELHSALLLGNNDGHPLRIETTLLAEPKVIEIDGEPVETLVSQFVSYEDGRIHEVALDWYAQADDGSVWYFGEDVFNYDDGAVADTDGTWLAGKDGPVAMIMPAEPKLGDVYRPENIPGSVFEEVTVTAVGLTVDGPTGRVEGAIVGHELHLLEGLYEDKTFAPGYGEFASGIAGNFESLAIAVPTDGVDQPVPAELTTIANAAADAVTAAGDGDWDSATASLDEITTAWAAHQTGAAVAPLLAVEMDGAIASLAGDPTTPAIAHRNVTGAQKAAIDVAMASLDLQLQFRPPAEIDLARFALWTNQVLVDGGSAEPDASHVAGDVTVLEWIWDRIAPTLDDGAASEIEPLLEDLRSAADDEHPAAAVETATALLGVIPIR